MFGLAVVGYLFLGGIGGALSLVGGLVGFRSIASDSPRSAKQSLCSLLGAAFGAAILALLAGVLLLLADAGNYQALFALFFPPKPSMLTFGSWVLAFDFVLLLILFIHWQGRAKVIDKPILEATHLFALLVGAAVVIYTGLFLASMRAVPFWHTFLVPLLFVFSSLSCALVLLATLAKITGSGLLHQKLARRATQWDIVAVVLELICALAFIALAYFVPREGSFAVVERSVSGMLSGENAWLWWGIFFGMGIVMTLVLDIVLLRKGQESPARIWNTLAPTFCVLCGAFAMRYCIVAAGIHPVLSF